MIEMILVHGRNAWDARRRDAPRQDAHGRDGLATCLSTYYEHVEQVTNML